MHDVLRGGALLQDGKSNSQLFRGLQFVRANFAAIAAISAIILVPCFWHRRIEAGDLPSHVYNAWLAQLIEQGKAPGLYTAWQWTNVLFDCLLLYSSKFLGFVAGTTVVVAFSVVIFFWGIFSFVAVAAGRVPWMLTPLIAMLSYGYTFNMGFFNYYLSIGLVCFALALCWSALAADVMVGAFCLVLAVLAHPIGALWCVATLTFVAAHRRLNGWRVLTLPALVGTGGLALHWYLANVSSWEINWLDRPFYFFNGSDQLISYSDRGKWIAWSCAALLAIELLVEACKWKKYQDHWQRFALLAELYALSFLVTSLLPQDLRLHPGGSWIGLLVNRLTVITAIFGLCALNCLKPRKSVALLLAVAAVVFSVVLYQDTRTINWLEAHAEQLTAQLPYGTLVIPTVSAPSSRIEFIGHVIDRACIGRCFTYSNYEPSSQQFRVRVGPEASAIASASADDAQEMAAGEYEVRPGDPPFVNIYQCQPDADLTLLCSRTLHPGDKTAPPTE
jgi:hypothetical protein